MGSSIAVVHRPSLQLPPEDADVTAQRKGIQTMTRISAFHSTSPMGCKFVEGPPDWLLHQLAAALRTALNLQLFNFDLMRPTERNAPGVPSSQHVAMRMLQALLSASVCCGTPVLQLLPLPSVAVSLYSARAQHAPANESSVVDHQPSLVCVCARFHAEANA